MTPLPIVIGTPRGALRTDKWEELRLSENMKRIVENYLIAGLKVPPGGFRGGFQQAGGLQQGIRLSHSDTNDPPPDSYRDPQGLTPQPPRGGFKNG